MLGIAVKIVTDFSYWVSFGVGLYDNGQKSQRICTNCYFWYIVPPNSETSNDEPEKSRFHQHFDSIVIMT